VRHIRPLDQTEKNVRRLGLGNGTGSEVNDGDASMPAAGLGIRPPVMTSLPPEPMGGAAAPGQSSNPWC
jgi:hypothetical protein